MATAKASTVIVLPLFAGAIKNPVFHNISSYLQTFVLLIYRFVNINLRIMKNIDKGFFLENPVLSLLNEQ